MSGNRKRKSKDIASDTQEIDDGKPLTRRLTRTCSRQKDETAPAAAQVSRMQTRRSKSLATEEPEIKAEPKQESSDDDAPLLPAKSKLSREVPEMAAVPESGPVEDSDTEPAFEVPVSHSPRGQSGPQFDKQMAGMSFDPTQADPGASPPVQIKSESQDAASAAAPATTAGVKQDAALQEAASPSEPAVPESAVDTLKGDHQGPSVGEPSTEQEQADLQPEARPDATATLPDLSIRRDTAGSTALVEERAPIAALEGQAEQAEKEAGGPAQAAAPGGEASEGEVLDLTQDASDSAQQERRKNKDMVDVSADAADQPVDADPTTASVPQGQQAREPDAEAAGELSHAQEQQQIQQPTARNLIVQKEGPQPGKAREKRQRTASISKPPPQKRQRTAVCEANAAASEPPQDIQGQRDSQMAAALRAEQQRATSGTREQAIQGLKGGSKAVSEPSKAAGDANPQPPAAGSHQDIITRKNRLIECHKQCSEIFSEVQRQAAVPLSQMMAEIKYLEGLNMTEDALGQTGIGKIISRLTKPLKPLQQLNEMEKLAGALLAQWMKAVQATPKAPVPSQPLNPVPVTNKSNAGATEPKPSAPVAVAAPPADRGAHPPSSMTQQAERNANRAGSSEVPVNGVHSGERQGGAQPGPAVPISGSSGVTASGKGQLNQESGAAVSHSLQVTKEEEAMRKRVRLILEMALLPPSYLLPPHAAAQILEESLYENYHEDDLSSGKVYLRRLKALMDCIEPGGQNYQPAIRDVIAAGKLHPADLACMSNMEMENTVFSLQKPLQEAVPMET